MMRGVVLLALAASLWSAAVTVRASPVGERHLVTTDATAALRDAEHSDRVRITLWYPAADGAREERIDLGPPGKPLLMVGAVAPDAAFARTATAARPG
jgi:hypothetical protein